MSVTVSQMSSVPPCFSSYPVFKTVVDFLPPGDQGTIAFYALQPQGNDPFAIYMERHFKKEAQRICPSIPSTSKVKLLWHGSAENAVPMVRPLLRSYNPQSRNLTDPELLELGRMISNEVRSSSMVIYPSHSLCVMTPPSKNGERECNLRSDIKFTLAEYKRHYNRMDWLQRAFPCFSIDSRFCGACGGSGLGLLAFGALFPIREGYYKIGASVCATGVFLMAVRAVVEDILFRFYVEVDPPLGILRKVDYRQKASQIPNIS